MNTDHAPRAEHRGHPSTGTRARVMATATATADAGAGAGADRLLAQRFSSGDPSAIRTIHEKYASRMYAVAHHVLGDPHLAADAVQQAFLQAWRAATSYDPTRPLGPWLFTITRRAAIDTLRRHTDRNRTYATELLALGVHTPVTIPDEETPWLVWQVRTALTALPTKDQTLIELVYYHQYTHAESAERLGIPIGTVKSRLHRAQRKLNATLQHLAPDTSIAV